MKPKTFFTLFLPISLLFFYLTDKEAGKETDMRNKHLLQDLNLKLRGRINSVDAVRGYNGTGVIEVVIT